LAINDAAATSGSCKVSKKTAGRFTPWVHLIIANDKNVIRGTHRGVSGKRLRAYLSEITYRFSRRFWERELFDHLIQACIRVETITCEKLIQTAKA
jgi:hypothetical protein